MGFFGTTEIAPYEVVQKWDDLNVELRSYSQQMWVCTNFTASKLDDHLSSAFYKLFQYIRGANKNNVKIPMTKPVCVESRENPADTQTRLYTMGFYVPNDFQSDVPVPTDADVYVKSREPMRVYSRFYGGYSNDDKMNNELKLLGQNLKALNLSCDWDRFFFAGYDPPFKPFYRHNEVWFVSTAGTS